MKGAQDLMRVRIYATLRELLETSAVELKLEQTMTAGEALERLVERFPVLDGKLWDADRVLTGYVMVLLNGRSIEWLQGLATLVTDDDALALFPPVGGGDE
jgi:molybdopterin synthase sulfur carrier subunit